MSISGWTRLHQLWLLTMIIAGCESGLASSEAEPVAAGQSRDSLEHDYAGTLFRDSRLLAGISITEVTDVSEGVVKVLVTRFSPPEILLSTYRHLDGSEL